VPQIWPDSHDAPLLHVSSDGSWQTLPT